MWNYFRAIIDRWKDYPIQAGVLLHNRYEIKQLVGMGSYGLAYEASDRWTGQQVLIKQHRPSKGDIGRNLLKREAELLSELRHDAIPQLLDQFQVDRRTFIAMTYITGLNLEQVLFEQQRAFTELEALSFIQQLSDIVVDIHRQGVIHLDIRIPNVLLNDAGIHLIDFGLARRLHPTSSEELTSHEDLSQFDGEMGASRYEIKRRMRLPMIQSDWYAMGHFLLFLLYSGYTEAEQDAERGWKEELQLHTETERLLDMMLQHEDLQLHFCTKDNYRVQLQRAIEVLT
ncbi:serine/threonine protein kinase [Paenibacillus sp. 481]|uniref:serine/threonine protein kinase n=1 Tax=Paenibacillus sp. 481 TaxID=2835869 RepID=UPI001E38D139|nr:protein kinase [Paenibacillus sp. 481]UHA74363.1 protein kinase [Paenibacillus sp. 481]